MKKGLCFPVTQLHHFGHRQPSLLKHTCKQRDLCGSLTKALVPNVLPGPDRLCANDPVVLPVSVRPVSACGLKAVCTNLSSWGSRSVQFASLAKFLRNGLVLTVTGPLFYRALPYSLHALLVHGELAESTGALLCPLSIHWCKAPLACLPEVLLNGKQWRILTSHLFVVKTFWSRG